VIAAVIVVVAVVAGLFLAGVIPISGSSSSSNCTGAGSGYNVTFSESGLPTGTSWSVTFAGCTHSSTTPIINFSAPNGIYSYTVGSVPGFTSTPASGNVPVSGKATSEAIVFSVLAPGQYTVTFTETGLPIETSWSVTLHGTTLPGTGTEIVFTEANGTYSFTAESVDGYTSSPGSGQVIVNGAPAAQTIRYTLTTGGSGQNSYSQAEPVAQALVGSGWMPVFAGGEDFATPYTNTSPLELNASCPLSGGSGSWPTIQAWTGNYSNGFSSVWFFYFYESSGPALEVVTVQGSTATDLGSVTGQNCVGADAKVSGLAGIVDSTVVAAAIAGNASGYVAAHPSATSAFTVLSGETFDSFSFPPSWYVLFTTCTPNGGGSGSNFTAILNASSGALLESEWTNGTCGSHALDHVGGVVGVDPSRPFGSALELRRP
jgi:hypothetical protein